jgi:hypothetical protein
MGIACSTLQSFEGKGPLSRSGHRWEGTIKLDHKEIE